MQNGQQTRQDVVTTSAQNVLVHLPQSGDNFSVLPNNIIKTEKDEEALNIPRTLGMPSTPPRRLSSAQQVVQVPPPLQASPLPDLARSPLLNSNVGENECSRPGSQSPDLIDQAAASCYGESSGDDDPNLIAQKLAVMQSRRQSALIWLKESDFGERDESLDWLRFQFVSSIHDSPPNESYNLQVIHRGKVIVTRQMEDAKAMYGRDGVNRVDVERKETAPQPMNAPPQPPPTPSAVQDAVAAPPARKRKRNTIDPDHYAHVVKDCSVDPPEYQCTICKRQFKNRLNIRYHIACADETAGHACKDCGRIFKSSSHLTYHLRTAHGGEKPYKCRFCEKAFAQSVKLKRHERTHTGERPFKCDTCQHTFTTKYNLKEHENIHKAEKPYACVAGCGATFADRNNLRRHEVTHEVNSQQQRQCAKRNGGRKAAKIEKRPPPSFQRTQYSSHPETPHDLEQHMVVKDGPVYHTTASVDAAPADGQPHSINPVLPEKPLSPDQTSYHITREVNREKQEATEVGQPPSLEVVFDGNVHTAISSEVINDPEPVAHEAVSDMLQEQPPGVLETSSSRTFKRVKETLQMVKGDGIVSIINRLSSKQRNTLINIFKLEAGDSKSAPSNKVRPSITSSAPFQRTSNTRCVESCRIDTFSDISTGSKKEFLRRYKRQVLEEKSSCSYSCPSASDSISAMERCQLFADGGDDHNGFDAESDSNKVSLVVPRPYESTLQDESLNGILRSVQDIIRDYCEEEEKDSGAVPSSNNSTHLYHPKPYVVSTAQVLDNSVGTMKQSGVELKRSYIMTECDWLGRD